MEQSNIQELSKLCKIRLSDQEQKDLLQDFESILEYVEQLSEVNTENTAPCYQVVQFEENVLAEDEEDDVLDVKEYLKNAPDHIGTMIKTPPVIKF